MRKPRGKIYEAPGIFHLESNLHPDRPRFTKNQAELYETWLCGLTEIYGFDLLFWQFHAAGFSIIVETSKASAPSTSKLAEGLNKIAETKLADHISAPEQKSLHSQDTSRLERFLRHYHSLMEFAKGLKQRISRQHNRSSNTPGNIWADRMRVYRLPSQAHELTEVAAFIFAYPQIHGQAAPSDWPGSFRSVLNEGGFATRGLERIFRNRRSNEAKLQTLKERAAEIIQTVHNANNTKAPSSKSRRGRRPQ